MASSLVTCSYCFNSFLKDNRHINENIKLENRFYCSPKCQYTFKNKQKQLICENKSCKKKFKRAPCNISPHNFCSRSCAAIYNNMSRLVHRVGIRQARKIRARRLLTEEEKKVIRLAGSVLGGKNRWLNFKSEYNKKSIILAIQNFVDKNGRLPVKREMNRFYRPARFYFETWNNAIEAAGFRPNPVLFAKHQVANDGHICDSVAEKIIDDYLSERKIIHERNIPYPKGKLTADFKIGNQLIEYFGLTGEHVRYDELRLLKQRIVKSHRLQLIEIYPKDLYPKSKLDSILSL